MKEVKVSMNIPVCLEFLMLGLCKIEMRKFWYHYIKKQHDDKAPCVSLIQIVLSLASKPMVITKIFQKMLQKEV